jgi:flagellar hook-associated protein 2
MGVIRLPGLLTGIDTAKLVSQLMMLERRTVTQYQQRQAVWSERQIALSTLEAKLQTLKSAAEALSDASELRVSSATSSDTDILTAEASNDAFEGSHTVIVNQLANAERWVHTAGKEYAEDGVGAGTFLYSYNHQETTITTTADTTLEDLVGLINNDANNPGVTAGLLYYNHAYHLVLNGNDAGSDYAISVNAYNTEVLQAASSLTKGSANAALATKIVDLVQFAGTLATGESITISGKQHDGTVVSEDLLVTKNTTLNQLIQEINDAFDGTATATLVNGQVRLTDHASGTSQMELSLTYDGTESTLDIPAISSSNREVWQAASALTEDSENAALATKIVELDQFAGALVGEESITIGGKQHDGTAVSRDLAIEADTTLDQLIHEINYHAFGGTATATLVNGQIRLTDYASGTSQMELSLTYDDGLGETTLVIPAISESVPGETVTASLAGFATADFTETQSAQDSQIKVDGYPAGGAEWITRSSNTVVDVISGVTLHLHDTGTVQVSLARDIKSIEGKLNALASAYNAAVSLIEEKTGYNAVEKKAGVLMGDAVVSGLADNLRLPLIQLTRGFLANADSFLLPGQLGLELNGDGQLNLTSGTFNEAIADDYLDVLALIGADKTGSSDSNTIQFYGASSDHTTAGTYDVQVTIADGVITNAGIKLHDEADYRNATFNGNIITGNSLVDTNGDPVYPESGLQLSVNLDQEGPFTATVRVKQGFAGAMADALDRILQGTTGALPLDRKNVDDHIDHLKDQIEVEEGRLTQKEARLVAKYARLEKTMALLQRQLAALGMTTA